LTLPLLASLFEVTPVVLLSAATPALLSADRTLRGSLNVFWCSLLASHAVGWLLLALAAYRLKRTMDAPVTVLPVSRSHRSPANEPDLPLVHRRRWVSALDREQPIEWLVYWRQQVKGTVWFIALMALSAGGWVQIVRYANALTGNPIASGVGLPQELGFSIAGAAIVAWMAGRLFVEGRRNGELELVLSTPAGAESLVLEQTTLLGRLFPWPVLLMQVPLLPWALSEPLKASFLVAGEVQNGWALFYPVTLLLQVLNTYLSVQALCYVGVWLSGWGPTRLRSVLWTVLLVKGPAVLLLLMGWGLFGLTRGEILPRYWLTWCIPQILVTAFHLFLLQRTGSVLFKARKAGRYGRLAENGGRSESSNDHSRCGTQERGG
jgi:hypothetical protein